MFGEVAGAALRVSATQESYVCVALHLPYSQAAIKEAQRLQSFERISELLHFALNEVLGVAMNPLLSSEIERFTTTSHTVAQTVIRPDELTREFIALSQLLSDVCTALNQQYLDDYAHIATFEEMLERLSTSRASRELPIDLHARLFEERRRVANERALKEWLEIQKANPGPTTRSMPVPPPAIYGTLAAPPSQV